MKKRNRQISRVLAFFLVLAMGMGASALASTTVYGYSEGLALATDGKVWGYVNTSGKVVIPIQFESAQSFQLGLALVEKNNRLGVIRTDGRFLIPAKYDTLTSIGYGLYLAQKGSLWGVVSLLPFPGESGGETQELFPITYDSIALGQNSGLTVLTFLKNGESTVVPVTALPGMLAERKAPSAQFPLIQGRIPTFRDVGPRDWYSVWADIAYNVGLMDGKSGNLFDPMGTLTVAEALRMAANMESRYTGDDFHLQPVTGQPWYSASVAYCVASGIIREGEFTDYTRPVTRAEMARIFAATALGRSMPLINDLDRVKASLPDVQENSYGAEAIYGLYAKGIFTGTDGNLTFRPEGVLTRAEAAAIMSRMARTEQRVSLWDSRARSAILPTPFPEVGQTF